MSLAKYFLRSVYRKDTKMSNLLTIRGRENQQWLERKRDENYVWASLLVDGKARKGKPSKFPLSEVLSESGQEPVAELELEIEPVETTADTPAPEAPEAPAETPEN